MSNEKIMQFQQLRQQLQQVISQEEQLNMQMMETSKALEELKTAKDEVYKIAGTILIKSDKAKVESGLKDQKEEAEVKIRTLQKHEKTLKDKLQSLQAELMKNMPKGKAE